MVNFIMCFCISINFKKLKCGESGGNSIMDAGTGT